MMSLTNGTSAGANTNPCRILGIYDRGAGQGALFANNTIYIGGSQTTTSSGELVCVLFQFRIGQYAISGFQ
jgi:hypothetical protein